MGLGSGLGLRLGSVVRVRVSLALQLGHTLTTHAALCALDVISHSPFGETSPPPAPAPGAAASAHTAPRATTSSAVQSG